MTAGTSAIASQRQATQGPRTKQALNTYCWFALRFHAFSYKKKTSHSLKDCQQWSQSVFGTMRQREHEGDAGGRRPGQAPVKPGLGEAAPLLLLLPPWGQKQALHVSSLQHVT